MRQVQGAQLVRYNANSAGHNSGDCVKRALSMAFDMDYNEISKLLRAESKATGMAWNSPLVYRGVARELGAGKFVYVPYKETTTLDEFIDDRCQSGTWLIETGHKPDGGISHIVCVIDGKLFDSWDSRDQYVGNYSEVTIDSRREFTDIQDHMEDLAGDFMAYISDEMNRCVERYANKGAEWANEFGYRVTKFYPSEYHLVCRVECTVDPTSYNRKPETWTFKFVAVLHPTDTIEDADRIMKATAKQRVYDRMWTVNDLERKAKETYEAEQEQGGKVDLEIYGDRKRGHAFWRNMPGWARAACTEIYIDRPGRYTNSYEVRLQEPGTGASIKFWAPTADVLRKELDLYHRTGQVIGQDYELADIESGNV